MARTHRSVIIAAVLGLTFTALGVRPAAAAPEPNDPGPPVIPPLAIPALPLPVLPFPAGLPPFPYPADVPVVELPADVPVVEFPPRGRPAGRRSTDPAAGADPARVVVVLVAH